MLARLARRLVLLAIALAVPIQGIAAVSAGLCTALEQHGAAGHSHDGAPSHHHDESSGSDSSHAHCPPCVSCCAAAAIVSFSVLFSPQQPANFAIAAFPGSFHEVSPDKLDRPPLAF